MIAELINTGSELMLGRVLNTHQQWVCRQLSDLGYVVSRQVSVPDTAADIQSTVREALARADLVITTGGLGPTSDDLTRETISRMLGRKLLEDAETLARIREFFSTRNRPMPERTRIQAMVPEGASALTNWQGTAPGLFIPLTPNPFRGNTLNSWLIMLPGPTRELRPLFRDAVIPRLREFLPPTEFCVCHTLRTTELGESAVEEALENGLKQLRNQGLEIGYCARPGQVDVRLAARGRDAGKLVEQAEELVRTQLGSRVFGTGEENLEEIVLGLLRERNETLAIAESCTGGYLAHRLTNVPGSSAVFRAGWVTYSNESKQLLLGVHPETLERYGAVSEQVAAEMADGARREAQTQHALAITGIAGPTGGTPVKPVGTAFIALASDDATEVWPVYNPWDRPTFKEVTTQQALNRLRLVLQKPRSGV